MLGDKKMFGVSRARIGQVTSELIYYSIPFSVVASVFTSYIYELLGRKWTMAISYFLTGFVYVWFPHTAPHYW